jgi:LysR family transcriptional regulator, glycine cleavage system transcriptional activator
MNGDGRRFYPPIGALQSFVAAARHGSFSKVAAELGLTQGAVSRQIAVLEDWTQRPLFDRVGRRVVLNAQGAAYLDEIEPALSRIRRATQNILSRRPANELTIATLPSFGMRWLAPRLPALTASHSGLIVNFAARSTSFNFADENFDAAIHFGDPTWPGVVHDFLFRENAVPMVSPQLLAQHCITQPRDLLALPLLHVASRPTAWQDWARRTDPGYQETLNRSAVFEQFLMLAQAAVAGTGVALLPTFLAQPELMAGSLVVPFDISTKTEAAYYLVYPEGRLDNPNFAVFRNWLLEAAGMGILPDIGRASPPDQQ